MGKRKKESDKVFESYDFTFLYHHIYLALKEMEPHIIGGIEDECYDQYVRRFKLAISLSDRLRHDAYWLREPHSKAIRILHKILTLESTGWWV